MGTEIERKYLVKHAAWRSQKEMLQKQVQASGKQFGQKYAQGYIPTANDTTIRLRTVGDLGYLTIKSKTVGYTRAEFEYQIPLDDAEEMLANLCQKPAIEKFRYTFESEGLTWEVDEFLGENAGLIIAEVELQQENQAIALPSWIDREVRDKKYFNSSLVKHPYSQWRDK